MADILINPNDATQKAPAGFAFDPGGNLINASKPPQTIGKSAEQIVQGVQSGTIAPPVSTYGVGKTAMVGGGSGVIAAPGTGVTSTFKNAPPTTITQPGVEVAGTPSEKTPPVVQTSDAERIRIRKEETERIKAELTEGLVKPGTFQSADQFKTLREQQGIVKDEEELNVLRQEAAAGQQELRKFKETMQGGTEFGRLGRVSDAERNLSFRMEDLAIREQAVLNRVNTKNAYINTALKLAGDDYETAYKEYTDKFNVNLKAVELYNQELDDQQKDALTMISTIGGLLKDKNITELDPSLSSALDSAALKLGMEPGTFQSVFTALPQSENLTPIKTDDGIYFFSQAKGQAPKLLKVEKLPDTNPDTQVVQLQNGSDVLINKRTGEIIKTIGGGSGGGGVLPTVSTAQPKQDFNQFLAQEEQKAGLTFGPAKRAELQKQFDAQPQPKADISKFHPTVQLIIKGQRKISGLTQKERDKFDSQLNQAAALGLIPAETTAEQYDRLNALSKEREASPVLRAVDRTPIAKSAVNSIKNNPKDATAQLNLAYSYIQILDTYQSAVKEGELELVGTLQSKLGKLKTFAESMTEGQIVNADTALQIANATQTLVNAVNEAAKTKDKSFESRAKTLKIGDLWSEYKQGFTPEYEKQNMSKAGQTSSGLRYTIE